MEVGNGALTDDQNRAHFTMWCILASPLIAGNDVSNMSDSTRSILTNKHAIAVNQDKLGKQAVCRTRSTTKLAVDVLSCLYMCHDMSYTSS